MKRAVKYREEDKDKEMLIYDLDTKVRANGKEVKERQQGGGTS